MIPVDPTGPVEYTEGMDYREAVEWCYRTRWAELKDGERARSRALRCSPHLPPGEPFSTRVAYDLRSALLGTEKLAPGSVNRHLSAYFTAWRAAAQTDPDLPHPTSGLLFREPRGRTRVISEDEYRRMRELIPGAYSHLVAVLWFTGCRVSEALAGSTRVIAADGPSFAMVLENTKNGDDRMVPISGETYRHLGAMGRPEHLSQSSFNRAWKVARMEMGLEVDGEFVPHALRHTAITRWVAAGVPLPVVAKLAGHRSLKTTLKYTHLNTRNCLDALLKAGVL